MRAAREANQGQSRAYTFSREEAARKDRGGVLAVEVNSIPMLHPKAEGASAKMEQRSDVSRGEKRDEGDHA